MSTSEQTRSPEDEVDGFLEAMMVGASELSESRVLDALVGTFDVVTQWEPVVGRGLRRSSGRCEGAWVYDGRMVDTRQFADNGDEVARHTYAYDRVRRDYVAIALNVMTVAYDVERGQYHPDENLLIFEATEPLFGGRSSVRVRRTVHFVDPDQYTVGISYPDVPPQKCGPMYVTCTRVE